ncbi:MAG: hypothetical protein EBW30_09145 [Synechococcaceae bacterium WB7_3xG_012]|nr:hypothetical protein [Synechococcaceae bacterium WB7_3xG_012]
MLLGTGLPFQRTDNRGSYSLQSTRGFRLAGRIGTRITFESRMTQNRLIEVGPIRDFERKVRRVGSIPGAGMSLGWGRGGDGYDYAENEVHFLDAVGIIAYEDDYFNIRFGRDRNRYGFAQGSPLLSPIHAPIDQLQILFNTDKFSYGMLLMSLVSPDKRAVRGQLSPVNVVGEANQLAQFDLGDFPVTWTVLDSVLTSEESRASKHVVLHENRAGNLLITGKVKSGEGADGLGLGEVSVDATMRTSYVEHAPIEPEAGCAWMDGDVLTISACTQAPVMDQEDTAKVLGLPLERVRIAPAAAVRH